LIAHHRTTFLPRFVTLIIEEGGTERDGRKDETVIDLRIVLCSTEVLAINVYTGDGEIAGLYPDSQRSYDITEQPNRLRAVRMFGSPCSRHFSIPEFTFLPMDIGACGDSIFEDMDCFNSVFMDIYIHSNGC
jgi:hypothetical protein